MRLKACRILFRVLPRRKAALKRQYRVNLVADTLKIEAAASSSSIVLMSHITAQANCNYSDIEMNATECYL